MKGIAGSVVGMILLMGGLSETASAALEQPALGEASSPDLVQAQAKRERPRANQERPRMQRRQMAQGMVGFSHLVVQHADELQLTDEQLGQTLRLQRQHQEERAAIRSRLRSAMMATGRMLLDPSVDKETVDEHVDAHAEAFQEWADNMWSERREVTEILTPEQQEALAEQLPEMVPPVPADHPD